MLILGQKSYSLGPTIFKIPQLLLIYKESVRFGIHEQQPFYSECFSSLIFWSKLTFDPSFSTEILIKVDPSCIARPYMYKCHFPLHILKM